jgi:long-subunit fatty acid transport protein
MKRFFITIMVLSSFLSVYAGGLLTNTNQSVHFLRNPARGASMEIDAVYTNPAGLSKLSANGFHFSLNNQSAFQTRTITSTYAPFAGYGGETTKVFDGKTTAPVIPSLFAAYKTGKWVVSANLGVIGGGGKITFDKGLASFEAPVSMIPAYVNQLGTALPLLMPGATLTANQYAVNTYMEGSSIIYDAQLGGTYAINNMFSAYAGARVNIVNNSYTGHLNNIMINPTSNNSALGNGDMISAYDYFNAMAQMQGLPDNVKGDLTALAHGAADKNLDCTQSGVGVTPILGFNFNWKNLNVGAKYEFITKIDVKNKTTIDEVGQFPDGAKTPYDIPAWLSLGAQYKIIPSVSISAGYHHFFDSNAKMANDKQKHIDGGINEYLLGAEWQINKMFLISAGGQITRTGVTDDYQTDMAYSLHSFSAGFGGAINVTEKIRINLAYFFTKYEDWTKKSDNYNGLPLPGQDVFSRTNNVIGIGVDFRF